ncbi:hypothetical protein SAMN05428995_101896 [Loktanella sp. DSM 29012]|uniref:DUF484 family protein n=1 Tax=Loktanella gaetbuli TaxID=2881335 RepID=A0ABS8BWS3_9RHOB|nr:MULTISPECIES: DUF484 family protein [Loktanella]KQI69301.1 recombinase XerC [Loktanella sp. 3ANDIMAR09]MCB5200200.1 DUF484 family protein [Loktanella gaetbuli]SEP81825.1 hypothetical protein SAMN05428995_101896 [Loktanella sp. DSM 29012]
MSSQPQISGPIRDRILSDPQLVLEDHDIMRALVAANEKTMGSNIVDLRGIAMERLEARLDRLEDTHRSVIAAAYDNLAGTNQVHRAVLRLMEASKFETFLADLAGDVADTMRVDAMRLVLETQASPDDPAIKTLSGILSVGEQGYCDAYITRGRDIPVRTVTLRQVQDHGADVYGEAAEYIRSEACLKLDLGTGRLPGMLVMGSEDPHLFTPQQGPDLLTFFGGVFERTLKRWLEQGAA